LPNEQDSHPTETRNSFSYSKECFLKAQNSLFKSARNPFSFKRAGVQLKYGVQLKNGVQLKYCPLFLTIHYIKNRIGNVIHGLLEDFHVTKHDYFFD